MTLLFTDGFDTGDIKNKWSNTNQYSTTSTTTRFGSGRAGIFEGILYQTITPSAKVIFGGATILGSLNTDFLYFHSDGGATEHIRIGVNASGFMTAKLGATVIATATTGQLATAVYTYIEASVTLADAGGRIVVRAGGVTVIDFTGDTRNGGTSTNIDQIRLSGTNDSSSGAKSWDDIYICNGLGTTNNDFLGDVRILTLLPTGSGSSTQMTPTGVANNWDNVNDIPMNTATYNGSATAGHRDTYAMADLPAGYTVLGIVGNLDALKSDAGTGTLKAALKSGAGVYYGATRTLGAAVLNYQDMWETDPATSAAWTATNVNATEFGAEVV